jgi:hypothetical protein
LASFFSFFCHKAFCCCCCNDDCWWVLGGLVVFLCSNPVSFGVLFHDRVCDWVCCRITTRCLVLSTMRERTPFVPTICVLLWCVRVCAGCHKLCDNDLVMHF